MNLTKLIGNNRIPINEIFNLIKNNSADLEIDMEIDENLLKRIISDIIMHAEMDIMHILVDKGLDINILNHDGDAPLHIAIAAIKEQITNIGHKIKYLITSGADVNIQNNRGKTPLHLAASSYYKNLITLLIEYEADVNIQDDMGDVPYNKVFGYRGNSTAELLATNGTDPNIINNNGASPFYMALRAGRVQQVTYFIENYQIDINQEFIDLQDNHDPDFQLNNNSPLHVIIKANRDRSFHHTHEHSILDLVKFFIKNGVDPDKRNINGKTALHCALEDHRSNIAIYLITQGADINNLDNYNNSSLHYACSSSDIKLLNYLISKIDNINIQNNYGSSPLHHAAVIGNFILLNSLLENGANVNIRNNAGITPLHITAEKTNLDCLDCLIQHGADVNIRTNEGDTPLHFAADRHDNLEILNYLVTHGASVNVKNRKHELPHDIACYNSETILALAWWHGQTIDLYPGSGPFSIGRSKLLGSYIYNQALKDDIKNTIRLRNSEERRLRILPHLKTIWERKYESGLDIGSITFNFLTTSDLNSLLTACLIKSPTIEEEKAYEDIPITMDLAFRAAKEGGLDEIIEFIKLNQNEINTVDANNETLLQIAIENGHFDIVKLLINNDANIYFSSDQENNAIEIASLYGHTDIAQWITEYTKENRILPPVENRFGMFNSNPPREEKEENEEDQTSIIQTNMNGN